MTQSQADLYRRWKQWEPGQFGAVADQSLTYRAELRRAGYESLGGIRVLEIGFGNGSFMAWAIENGMEYVGTEIDPELVQRARDHGVRALMADESFDILAPFAPFDLCVAWDVLEHIPRDRLAIFLRQVRSQLTDHGVLIARVPSGDSPFSGAIQSGDPTHYAPMGSGTIRYLAAQSGFSRVDVRPAALPVWGLGLGSAVRRLIVHACDQLCHPVVRLLMRNTSAVLTPNMVFTMRQSAT
jgi:SAM-dependent methyltransferase